jgi:F420H(2)-dependent quinone reductase
VVTGSADGSAAEPWWFKNRRSTREAEIEIGRRNLAVAVAVASGEQHAILWKRLVARTLLRRLSAEGQRQMPLAILMPADALPIVLWLAPSSPLPHTVAYELPSPQFCLYS